MNAKQARRGSGRKTTPLWLRRLDLVKRELSGCRWPSTAEEGLRQTAALSNVALRMLEQGNRMNHPEADRDSVYRIAIWKKERARFFR